LRYAFDRDNSLVWAHDRQRTDARHVEGRSSLEIRAALPSTARRLIRLPV